MSQFKKIALITGANKGIGFETARQLAGLGVHVIIGGRNDDLINSAVNKLSSEGLDVEALLVDITDSDSIKRAAQSISERHGHLDILINNAGIRIEEYGLTPSQQPMQKWRDTFNTNLFGMVELTITLLDLIKKSDAGRIVNVSSLLASLSIHTDKDSYAYSPYFKSLPAYSASKSAVNSWTVHLAYELRDTAIKVNAVHPGYTITDMNEGEGVIDVKDGAKSSVIMALLDENGPNGTYTHMNENIGW
ncbi:SDR family oxidoreductase [Salmonella enterica subsp. enterica]|nr:SDR family oxidoreductase [Salmonella enterica subsp. enterica serovar Mikawasima]EDN7229173.1 SDR family oxidoreductase [Salmonella enterica subsp. enterica serovar Mikawasima]